MMLATLAQLKDSLGIAQLDVTKDTLLNSSLFQANALIAGYIGVDLSDTVTQRSFTSVIDSTRNHLQLPVFPIIEVVSLSADGVTVSVDNNGWRLEPELGIIEGADGAWYHGDRWGTRMVAVYRSGYSPVPVDLQAVCINIAGSIYNNGGSLASSVAGVGGTGELKSLTMFDAMSMSFDVGSAGTSAESSGPQALLDAWGFVLNTYRCKLPVLA